MTSEKAFNDFLQAVNRETVLSRRAFALCWDAHDSTEYTPALCEGVLQARACNQPDDPAFHGLGLAPERFEEARAKYRAEYDADPAGFLEGAIGGGLWKSAAALLQEDLPPVRFVVDGLLPQGLALLASPPKFGKSWLCLDLCVKVARGGQFLGQPCNKSSCLYLALEDSENRLQDRLLKVLHGRPCPPGFYYTTRVETLDGGLLAFLETFVGQHGDCGLVVVDTLQKVRGGGGRPGSMYADDYRDMGRLKELADRLGICLLLVHHLRKMGDEGDPFARISGSNGILGAADTALVLTRLHRNDPETLLNLTGRDVDSAELTLAFDKESFTWRLLGTADEVAEQRRREAYPDNPIVKTIRRSLEENGGSWEATGKNLIDGCITWYGGCPADTPQALSKQLEELAPLLLEEDNIKYERRGRSGSGKIHHFKQLSELGALFGD